MRKETVDIDILEISRNGGSKISDVSKKILGRLVGISNPQRHHNEWH